MRSTKCSLKFSTERKRGELRRILEEYGRVVNCFIDLFWPNPPKKAELLKPVVDSVSSWFSYRIRKVAAREAIDMIQSAIQRDGDKTKKPLHRGKRMQISDKAVRFQESKESSEFDAWLHLSCIGEKVIFDIPLKQHRHFHRLSLKGKRLNAHIITQDYVQFSFEIETGEKREPVKVAGVDTGIKALASLDNGEHLGTDIESHIDRVKRCGHGKKGQQRAVRALRQRIDEVAKEVVTKADLLVVEKLAGITKNTKNPKRRLGKNMRRSIGRWNVGYWLRRLQQQCEWNRVSFRSVSPYRTSQTCSSCGHVDRRSRDGEMFRCIACGHECNADVNAARNILNRFLTGAYGLGCKPELAKVS